MAALGLATARSSARWLVRLIRKERWLRPVYLLLLALVVSSRRW